MHKKIMSAAVPLKTPRFSSVGLMTALCLLSSVGSAFASGMEPMAKGTCDFNNDGYFDSAIGAPSEDLGTEADAGVVHVIYGSNFGLSSNGDQLWHQNAAGVSGTAETGDLFGSALACGDFDGDGYDDLAVGVPGESHSSETNAGEVQVFYGGRSGLTYLGNQLWNQDSSGILDQADDLDRFGSVLEAGDFNGDGRDDLAVGVMAETFPVVIDGEDDSIKSAGAVNVIYGSSSGLTSTGNQFFEQGAGGISGVKEDRDLFGAALAAGDFNKDGFEDLAVGAPTEHLGSIRDAGAVIVIYGAASGLSSSDQLWSQDSSGIAGVAEANDRLGASLAAGDFDGDGYADLAMGAPGEAVGSLDDAGAVNIIYGGNSGLSSSGNQIWTQDSTGIIGVAEPYDRFGEVLAAADFNGDGRDDLAIGTPWEGIGNSQPEVGVTYVIYGSASGLDDFGNQWWHQDSSGILDANDPYQRFGSTLAVGDYNGDFLADLMIGVPGEIASSTDAGAVNVIYGSNFGGLDDGGGDFWHQNSSGILEVCEPFDRLSGSSRSNGMYRIPYADGTEVEVTGDFLTHTPQFRIDMHGQGGGPYTIVAAASGILRAVVDEHSEPTKLNNYVWIEHTNGEWTKYSHLATDSVTDLGWQEGDWINVGQALGIESNVGKAKGDHLHFEVAVPWDLSDPYSESGGYVNGENRDPVICNIPGEVFLNADVYIAAPCQ